MSLEIRTSAIRNSWRAELGGFAVTKYSHLCCLTVDLFSLVTFLKFHTAKKINILANAHAAEALVGPVRPDGKMKARLRKIVLEVGVRIAVVISSRGGLEKLSGKQTSITKAKVQSTVQAGFKRGVEFVADVAARAGTGGNGDGPAAGVEIVICGDEPIAYKCLFEFPFPGG